MDPDPSFPSFLNVAKKMSLKSDYTFLLGSCVVSGGKVLGKGWNRVDACNPLVRKFFGYGTIHAEMDAIYKTPQHFLKGSTLYVYRRLRNGSPAMSRPCKRCQKAIRSLGIRKVIYTIDEYPYYKVEKF